MSHPEDPDRTREIPANLDPRGVDRQREPYRNAAYDPRERRRLPPAPGGSAAQQQPGGYRGGPQPGGQRPGGQQFHPAAGQGYVSAGQQHGAPPYAPVGPGPYPSGPQASRKKRRGWWIFGSLVAVLVLAITGFVIYLDVSMNREDVLTDYAGRPAATAGTTWLLVGSDSRDDLTDEQKEELATGEVEGKRTDTIMLLHLPDGDHPATLVSLPRDTLVDIPGYGPQKLNAAFAFGGGQLLARTVEATTGLRIDRYAEIGFGGFVGIVDAIGGVDMCIDEPMNDPMAGLDLQAGCQTLDGAQALGYVRTRASARADLDRIERQRQFLSALLSKATSPGTLLNPLRSVPLAVNATGTLIVDNDVHLWHLAGMGLAMGSSDLVTTTVPIAGTPTIPEVGSVVQWNDQQAAEFFAALAADQPIPEHLLSS